MKHIMKCPKCSSYGLTENCPCGGKRLEPRPPKYSPIDKYGKYRRQAKAIGISRNIFDVSDVSNNSDTSDALNIPNFVDEENL